MSEIDSKIYRCQLYIFESFGMIFDWFTAIISISRP
jgi:hypothetical protein